MARSVKRSAREALFKRYGGEGGRTSNMWLVYSEKMSRDIAIPSDISLIYWLCDLEFNSKVVTYQYLEKNSLGDPDIALRALDGVEICVWISETNLNGGVPPAGDYVPNRLLVNPAEIKSRSVLAVHCLSALAFCAAIRGREFASIENQLILAERSIGAGIVKQLLNALPGEEESVVAGVIVRHIIRGLITADLRDRAFGRQTRWQLPGDHHDQ